MNIVKVGGRSSKVAQNSTQRKHKWEKCCWRLLWKPSHLPYPSTTCFKYIFTCLVHYLFCRYH
ncbi:hypothetical protein RHMOL_Rhmol02G0163400 [Rhododendron molle]|uniref:Uncharacterized protein n=1 Tax=Rhododendron molle TaxID=49168 RepID=A0ACC0PS46_RHOML|nr:hypothetical protein RHMOL_Rhmol02G0163400 [Rhododendron molle]